MTAPRATAELPTLSLMRNRLRDADRAVAALIVAYGSDRYLQSICVALSDHQRLLDVEEQRAGAFR